MIRVAYMLCLVFLTIVDAQSPPVCPEKAIFVFGDSLSDTGNIEYLGFNYLRPPYGESYTFPGSINPSRFSDGRLVVDFLAQAFGFPFVKPIVAVGRAGSYEKGANFAYGGATAATNLLASPFSLSTEVNQFLSFKFTSPIPYVDPSYFGKALYAIPEIGANDFLDAFEAGRTPAQVITTTVPSAIRAVRNGLETLYRSGSRSFYIFNVPPIGCIPYVLTVFGTAESPIDNMGCLSDYNKVAETYNAQLRATVTEYRTRWSDASIVFFDAYGASKLIYSNPEAYGFRKDKALVACCGYGGKYNYNPTVRCGTSGTVTDPTTNSKTFVNITTACPDPVKHLSWDGVHPTQALSRQLALQFLKGSFVENQTGGINISSLCTLDFSGF